MNEGERRKKAKDFADIWKGKGYEKGQSQPFWIQLLREVYGVENSEQFIEFENGVHIDETDGFIDGYIPSTKVLIEQKGIDKSLDKPVNNKAAGRLLTPFQQAKRYIVDLPFSRLPRYVVTCNFAEFRIYDMERPDGAPQTLLLKDLPNETHRLQFLVGEGTHIQKEIDVSVAAGKIVGRLYDCVHSRFNNPNNPETLRALNILCVRLVFCLYAENAGIFPKYGIFHDYLEEFDAPKIRRALIDLFKILNTPEDKRDPYLKDDNPILATFPYVNGGLFADESVEIPSFDDNARRLLLDEASSGFNWHGISPTIFGAVFESTLNTETRRKGGMHYTSPVNIHKVIDPLFLDDLTAELEKIEQLQASSPQRAKKRALEFQDKLAALRFLDPACGSGNFLTETYLSLRELENRAIKLTIADGQTFIKDVASPIKVSISQFYGIEINDFAVSVAKTAMWIAESQMLEKTEDILGRQNAGDFLPLKRYANIAEGNALKMDWSRLEVESGDLWHAAQQAEEHTPREAVSYDYIFGNPPFLGWTFQTDEQKEDMISVWRDEQGKPYDMTGRIDYVACWFFKAAELMKGTNVRTALVATNSIVQGEPVAALWKPLFERFGIHIDFAHRTFRWDSESNDKAHVHCVIVGFSSAPNAKPRVIFDGKEKTIASNINGYLLNAPNIFVERRSKPLCKVPEMNKGSQPTDDGNFLLSESERDELLKKEPGTEKLVKKFVGSEEFINGRKRWCLWLVGASPNELRAMPEVMKRVEAVREFRLASKKKQTREDAKIPTLFQAIRQPTSDYVVIPEVSSEKRRYVPMGFLSSDIICSNLLLLVPNATRFHFGVLTSDVHMAWMRAVCGRLEMRYRYSGVVYNNFPWASADEEQIQKISDTAQGIIDARAKFSDSTLADLYDELAMPKELRNAHTANDRAVRKLFGFSQDATEAEIVRELFQRYSTLVNGK